jgi:2-methylcitrate dehydratase PrpD
MTLSRELAEWVATLGWPAIPTAVQEQVPLRVLDSVGLMLVGAGTPAVAAARALAQTSLPAPTATDAGAGSTLLGAGTVRAVPGMAALVHGVAAHCRDFDDTFVDSVIHAGSVVIPTALAMAEATGASAADFGAAIVAGYEVAARIGAVAGRRFHARNLHATGVVGPLAAAATAGRLLGLSAERLSWAFGLAASMGGGLMAFTIDGGWSKWLHAGWAAHGGITAAQIANAGFRGPEHTLGGDKDLYSALLHGEAVEPQALVADLGSQWAGARAEFKYYPCAHVIHPYIDAVLELVTRHDLRPDDVASIECAIAPWAAAIVAEPREAKLRFDSELEAIASLPYQLAVAVADRHVGLEALDAAQRARPDLQRLAGRVAHRTDPALGHGFDGSLELRTRAGAQYRMEVAMPGSDATRLKQKFARHVQAVFDAAPARQPRFDAMAAAQRLATGEPDWRFAASLLAAAPVSV